MKQPRLGAIIDDVLGEMTTVQTPQGPREEFIKQLLARRLVRIALTSKNEKAALEAIRDIKEYTEGRTPVKVIGTTGDEDSLTDLAISVVPSGPAEPAALPGPDQSKEGGDQ